MKKLLLASTCALACAAASPALADGVAATAQGTFGNIAGFPSWSADGQVSVPLGWSDLSVEGEVGDRGADGFHIFDGGGSLIWTQPEFRVAGSVTYNRLTAGGSIDETQYGAGGQWFFGPAFTASVLGGGISGSASGGYIGGDLKWYFIPDVAVDGFVNYTSLTGGHVTDFGAHAEWLPMEDLPIAVEGNYTHVDATAGGFGSGNTDTWWVGLKLYLNDSPATTLQDRQRTGPLDTIAPRLHLID